MNKDCSNNIMVSDLSKEIKELREINSDWCQENSSRYFEVIRIENSFTNICIANRIYWICQTVVVSVKRSFSF